MDHSTLAIRCAGLVKRYSDVTAVDGLDLEVRTGECFGLLGPNGAGKTTTIEILEGLNPHDAGDVEVLGMRWGRDDRALRQRLGIQLQETQLHDKLTVAETLRLFRSFYDARPDDRRRHRHGRARIETRQPRRQAVGRPEAAAGGRLRARRRRPSSCFSTSRRPASIRSRDASCGTLLERFRAGRRHRAPDDALHGRGRACCAIASRIVDRGRVIALGTPRELDCVARRRARRRIRARGGPAAATAKPTLRRCPACIDVRYERRQRAAQRARACTSRSRRSCGTCDARPLRLSLLTTHSATLEDVFVRLTGRHLRDA